MGGLDEGMRDYIQLLRPRHWIKNFAVLAGPVFGLPAVAPDEMLGAAGKVGIAFLCFCLAASASYALNDALDWKADAHHPQKRNRPVARGAISPTAAVVVAIVLIVVAVSIASQTLQASCALMIAGYFGLIVMYSLALKRRIILDVIIIAVGFVIRASTGAQAIGVPISPWLVACTFTICMFMAFGKRRCELAAFDTVEEASEHRKTLLRYTPELLNHLISVSAGIAIMTFLLYTMDRDPAFAPPFNKHYLLYTLPLVCYGVFRYAMQVETGTLTGPMEIILKDRAFQATILLWTVILMAIVFERPLKRVMGVETEIAAPADVGIADHHG